MPFIEQSGEDRPIARDAERFVLDRLFHFQAAPRGDFHSVVLQQRFEPVVRHDLRADVVGMPPIAVERTLNPSLKDSA